MFIVYFQDWIYSVWFLDVFGFRDTQKMETGNEELVEVSVDQWAFFK